MPRCQWLQASRAWSVVIASLSDHCQYVIRLPSWLFRPCFQVPPCSRLYMFPSSDSAIPRLLSPESAFSHSTLQVVVFLLCLLLLQRFSPNWRSLCAFTPATQTTLCSKCPHHTQTHRYSSHKVGSRLLSSSASSAPPPHYGSGGSRSRTHLPGSHTVHGFQKHLSMLLHTSSLTSPPTHSSNRPNGPQQVAVLWPGCQ